MVCDVTTGDVVGCVWVMDIRVHHGRCRIGQLWFRPEETDDLQRIEALLLVLGAVMGTQKIDRVSMRVASDDPGLRDVLDNLGAQREGVLRDWLKRSDGSRIDVSVYSVLRTEWPGCVDGAIASIGGHISHEEKQAAIESLQTLRGDSVSLPLPRA